MSRMVDREGDGVTEGADGVCYLTVGRGIYAEDYEFLECHEWWTEMETGQPEKGKSALFFIIEQEIVTEKG